MTDVVPGSTLLSTIRTSVPRRLSQPAKTKPVGAAPTMNLRRASRHRRHTGAFTSFEHPGSMSKNSQ